LLQRFRACWGCACANSPFARPRADSLAGVTDVLVITGLSGAGRSQAADDLEDLGWFVVDNLPTALIEQVVDMASQPDDPHQQLCLVVGNASQQADMVGVLRNLRTTGHRVRVLFLDASTGSLVKRYGATRRRHPLDLARDQAGSESGIAAVIQRERELLQPVKAEADLVIDTSDLTVHQLKAKLIELFGPASPTDTLQIGIVSFGFKHGLPLDVDLVFDVRFLPNPYWDENLRPLSGLDDAVRSYVLDIPLRDASSTTSRRCSPRCCPRTSPRARVTCRSRSDAPVANIVRSRSPSASHVGLLRVTCVPA